MKQKVVKIGLSILIALAFILPSGAIMAGSSVEAPDAGNMAVPLPGITGQDPASILGAVVEAPDLTQTQLVTDITIPIEDWYKFYVQIANGPGVAQIEPEMELYKLSPGDCEVVYETSFEDNYNNYREWYQIDGDCSIDGEYDGWTISDARSSDGDVSFKNSMYDIYKGNQLDTLRMRIHADEGLEPFTIDLSEYDTFDVSFDVWVDGQWHEECWPEYSPIDFVEFNIWDCTGWVNPNDYIEGSDPVNVRENMISDMSFQEEHFSPSAPYGYTCDHQLPGQYYFFSTGVDIYQPNPYWPEADYSTLITDKGGGWWNVVYRMDVADLCDDENFAMQFVWHSDPEFQYEGAYIDNIIVTGCEDTREKIFQSHAQEWLEWGDGITAAFEFPLVWEDVELGCYEAVFKLKSDEPLPDGYDDIMTIPFCVGEEIDCIIDDLIVEDSFTGLVVTDGGRVTGGSDAHIIFTYDYDGNVCIENAVVTATAKKVEWDTVYETDFEGMVWSDTASFDGPQLWHKTSEDAYTGSSALGCFNKDTLHYENNMYINYAIGPSINMEDVTEAYCDYYMKWITEDEDDYALNMLMDEYTNFVLGCGGGIYGYQPDWVGPDVPRGIYQPFNLRAYYDLWVNNYGFFTDTSGEQGYDVGVGFRVQETDHDGYTNQQAEDNGEYWSGWFVDDYSVRVHKVTDTVWEDSMIIPGPICPGDDPFTAQFEWEDVPLSHYQICVSVDCADDIDLDNNELCQDVIVMDDLEKAYDNKVEFIDYTGFGDGTWGPSGSDYDWYLCSNPTTELYEGYLNSVVYLAPDHGGDCTEGRILDVDHLSVLRLTFDMWYELEGGVYDYVVLEYKKSDDLTELGWIEKERYEGWSGDSTSDPDDFIRNHHVNIGGLASTSELQVRFRIVSDVNYNGRGFRLDNFEAEDLFDVTQITDPAPVYEDFFDDMEAHDMANWCTEQFSYGNYWTTASPTEWCADWPEFPVNFGLIWATEIADAYEAYLSFEHEYDFVDSLETNDFAADPSWELNNWAYDSTFQDMEMYAPYYGDYNNWMITESFDFTGINQGILEFDLSGFNEIGVFYNYPDMTLSVYMFSDATEDEQLLGHFAVPNNDARYGVPDPTDPIPIEIVIDPESCENPETVRFKFVATYDYDYYATYGYWQEVYIDNFEVSCSETGLLELSTDGGENWFVLDEFTGATSGYIAEDYDLNAWVGNEILIRFRAVGVQAADQAQGGEWCVRDIEIIGKQDNNPPSSTATMSGTMADSGWYSSSVQIIITGTDDNGVKEIHYILDGVETVVAGDTASFTVSGNGAHNVEFWAVDIVGNVETPHNVIPTFRIDSGSPPTVAITAPEPGLYLFGNKLLSSSKVFIIGAFNIEATASDAESGVYRVQFSLDGDIIAEDTEVPFGAYCAQKHMGAGTIKVVAEDFSGNTAEDTLDITYYKFL